MEIFDVVGLHVFFPPWLDIASRPGPHTIEWRPHDYTQTHHIW